jgi:transposase-like protein
MCGMEKAKAIQLLGGSMSAAARTLGVTYHAVLRWPDKLSPRVSQRVVGAVARKYLPPEILELLDDDVAPAPGQVQ